jgi:hypothetical protein
MKKIFGLVICCISILKISFSQDYLTKFNGDELKVKVLEVTHNEVKYKKFDNLEGPIFTIMKSELFMIKYQNGSKDIFNEADKQKESTKNPSLNEDEMAEKGKNDAKSFYKGKNSGAGWTATTALLLSPLFGVIPAAICSSNEPNEDNLNAPNKTLMKNSDYNTAYTKQAHKIKKGKVWRSFGIASGVWVILIALL